MSLRYLCLALFILLTGGPANADPRSQSGTVPIVLELTGIR